MKIKILSFSLLLLWLTPAVVFAAPQNFQEVVGLFFDLLKTAIPLLSAMALLVFFYGLARFIWNAGDESKIVEGRQLMIWGIIGLFVMLSVWGIVNLLHQDVFGGDYGLPNLPV